MSLSCHLLFLKKLNTASGSVSHKYGSSSGSESFHHQAKNGRKTVLWLLYDFLPVFQIRIRMFLGLPDPLDRGRDPRIRHIRVRTKMSRIHNTDRKSIWGLYIYLNHRLCWLWHRTTGRTSGWFWWRSCWGWWWSWSRLSSPPPI